jgi:hypothetical protein
MRSDGVMEMKPKQTRGSFWNFSLQKSNVNHGLQNSWKLDGFVGFYKKPVQSGLNRRPFLVK